MLLYIALWIAATVAGLLPRRLWRHLEPPLPMRAAAAPAALLTLAIGFALAVDGFLDFAGRAMSGANAWMLRTLTSGPLPSGVGEQVALVPYGSSVLTPLAFLSTPLGLLSAYLVVSGAIRALAAYFDDPRGDFILSGVTAIVASASGAGATRAARKARERLEGPPAPDVLRRGAWCGIDADYVVLAARRKPEWEAGAIVMTATDWYRLGKPFDMDTPAGLRTAYPLTRLDTNEVVRRGIRYDLPSLSRASAGT